MTKEDNVSKEKLSYDCECLECGHKMTSEEHCADIKCPECGGEMRRAERPGVGNAARDNAVLSLLTEEEKIKIIEERQKEYSINWESKKLEEGLVLKVKEVPPKGISGLSQDVMDIIPERLSWWLQDCEDLRVAMRDEYVKQLGINASVVDGYPNGMALIKCDKGFYYLAKLPEGLDEVFDMTRPLELVEADMPETKPFVLMHHYWKGKQKVEHYDLFIGDNEQYVCLSDLSGKDSAAIKRTPYSKDFKTLGRGEASYVKANSPGNPSHMASWVKTVDEGEIIVLAKSDNAMRLKLEGKEISTIVTLLKMDNGTWMFSHQRELSGKGVSIMRMELQSNEAYLEGEDLIVPGMALSYGVWNGEYYPEDVVLASAHMLKGIPVAVGTHYTEKNVGYTRNETIENGGIRIEGVIEGKYALEKQRVIDGEFLGYSVEVHVEHDPMRRMIKKIMGYDRVVMVDIPACSVCTLDGVCNDDYIY